MSLMCIAKNMGGIKVVEPFMVESILGLNIQEYYWNEGVKFSDVFDLKKAHQLSNKKNFGQMVTFENFLKDAPRKILVAEHRCTVVRCRNLDALEVGRTFSELFGFELVGVVSLDYETSGKTTLKEIEQQLYSKFTKSDVVVIFPFFGGLLKSPFKPTDVYRLHISAPSQCYREYPSKYSYIRPSQLVRDSAQHYIDRYLSGKKYISVMIRLEFVFQLSFKDLYITNKSLHQILQDLNSIKQMAGIDDVFISHDGGRYGSVGIKRNNHVAELRPIYDSFLSQAVGDGMTLAELDSRFTNTTLRDNPGFVAMMQKTIAARGDVLVLIGGNNSNFQKSTLEYYKSLHENPLVHYL